MKRLTPLIPLLALALAAPAGAAARQGYATNGAATCDGYPRLPIETMKGMCAGLVLKGGPRMPRLLLPLADGRTWLLTDLGGWTAGQGGVWRIDAPKGRPATATALITGLAMPHGLALGPDGRVYVGEMSRVIAFDPAAAVPAKTVQVVVSGLPDNRLHLNRHPLSQIVFDANGDLLVNVGAPTDQCLDAKGRPDGAKRCAQTEGAEPLAGVRRYPYLGQGRWSAKFGMEARGLRNSLALARHPSGALLQAENSIDFPGAETPYEEVNVLSPAGRHFGWPYCFDVSSAAPAWAASKAMDCKGPAHAKPAALLPPHAAPLGMTWYRGAMFPELNGKLLMTWHGYREAGGRLVALDVDARGVPVASAKATYPVYAKGGAIARRGYKAGPGVTPLVLTPGWGLVAGKRPMGTPVGVTVAADGAIWVAEDHNRTVVRFAKDRP